MFRNAFIAAILFIFAGTAPVFGQPINVGYMNPQEVLNQVPERVDIEKKINAFVEQKRSEMQEKTTAFQDAVAEFQQNSSSMSEEQIAQREQELTDMQAELRQFQQNIQQQIQQRRGQLMSPIYDRMDKAIAAVAESMDLDFVLNEATGMGETIIYYSAEERLDITQQVLDRMQGESN